MLVEERSDVVNETGYEDQGPGLRLFLDYDTSMRRRSSGWKTKLTTLIRDDRQIDVVLGPD